MTHPPTQRVLVLGASGVLGRRIVRLAQAKLPGVEVLGGSRRARPERGERRVNVHRMASLREALADVDLVINAVGPFEYDPLPLLDACAQTDTIYCDLAEPAPFIEQVETLARERGVVAASGCSTLPGMVRVLAQRWEGAQGSAVRSLRVYLSLGSRKPVSHTLLYSLLRPLGRPAAQGHFYTRILSKGLREGGTRYFGLYPSAFDTGLSVGSRELPAEFYVGMDRAFIAAFLRAGATFLPTLSDGALMRWCRLILPLTGPVRWLGTSLGLLCLEALDAEGRVVDEVEVRAEHRGLDIPALPAVWFARHCLQARAQGRELPRGPLPCEAAFTPEDVRGWLLEDDYEVWTQTPWKPADTPAAAGVSA